MNLLDATVTEVIGEPFMQYERWFVTVKYNCWGSISEKNLMCTSEEDAKNIKVGHTFLT